MKKVVLVMMVIIMTLVSVMTASADIIREEFLNEDIINELVIEEITINDGRKVYTHDEAEEMLIKYCKLTGIYDYVTNYNTVTGKPNVYIEKRVNVDTFESFIKEGFSDCLDVNRRLIENKFEEKFAEYCKQECPEWGEVEIKIDYIDTYEGIDIYYLVGRFENRIDIYQIEGIYAD